MECQWRTSTAAPRNESRGRVRLQRVVGWQWQVPCYREQQLSHPALGCGEREESANHGWSHWQGGRPHLEQAHAHKVHEVYNTTHLVYKLLRCHKFFTCVPVVAEMVSFIITMSARQSTLLLSLSITSWRCVDSGGLLMAANLPVEEMTIWFASGMLATQVNLLKSYGATKQPSR